MYNSLTIDVEDYFMVSNFSNVVKFEDWPRHESRVNANTRKILDLLNRYDVKATFFILGWVAERNHQLVNDIHQAGHEVASHGYNHRLVYDLSPDEFRDDLRRSKNILEDITGIRVKGYRATSYSIVNESLWALDILIEEGFLYDSSIFPIHHDRYGIPDAQRFPHVIKRKGGSLHEFPPSTYRIFNQNVPISGGGYLRSFPLWLIRKAIRNINNKEGKPVVVYIHPWEIDTQQPRLDGSRLAKLRHYTNLKTTMPKLDSLLNEFKFRPIVDLIDP